MEKKQKGVLLYERVYKKIKTIIIFYFLKQKNKPTLVYKPTKVNYY